MKKRPGMAHLKKLKTRTRNPICLLKMALETKSRLGREGPKNMFKFLPCQQI